MNWWNTIVEFFTGAFQRAQGMFNYTQSTFNYAMNNISGVRETVDYYTEIGTTGATPAESLPAAITAVGSNATTTDVTTASGLAAAAYMSQSQARGHATVRALQESGATVSFISDPTRSDPECIRAIIAEKPGELIVAFRGTQVPGNGIGIDNAFNASCVPVEFPGVAGATAHAGFMKCYNGLSTSIQDKIRKAIERGDRITFTGHSQGGALAQLAAADVARTPGAKLRLITFGAPRVGNHQMTEHLQQHVPDHLRFTHVRDPIPALCPPGCGFEHSTRPIFIRGNQFSVGTMNETGTFFPTLASTAVSLVSADHFNSAHSQLNYDHAVNGRPVALPPVAGDISGIIAHGLPSGLFGNAVSVPAVQAAR